MKEVELINKFRQLEKAYEAVHAGLVSRESQIYAMWGVMNVLLHILKETPTVHLKQDAKAWLPKFLQLENRPLYSQEEFEEIGTMLHDAREAKIKELANKAKETGEPIPSGAIPADQLTQAIESLPTSAAFRGETPQPKLSVVKDSE